MDGDEEDGPYGRGETEIEAVKELAEQLRAELKRENEIRKVKA